MIATLAAGTEPGSLRVLWGLAVSGVAGLAGFGAFVRFRLGSGATEFRGKVAKSEELVAQSEAAREHANEALRNSAPDLVLYNHDTQQSRMQQREIQACFRRYSLANLSTLVLGFLGAGVLLYGTYLGVTGELPAGVMTDISSAVPDTFAVVAWRVASSAEKRADEAFRTLSKIVDNQERESYVVLAAARLQDAAARESIQTIAALHTLFPNAGPADITDLMREIKNQSASGRNGGAPARRPVPRAIERSALVKRVSDWLAERGNS